jgi:hypothetical protein
MNVAVSNDGRVFRVERVAPYRFVTCEVLAGGHTRRHLSPSLPARGTRKGAQADFEAWARTRGYDLVGKGEER